MTQVFTMEPENDAPPKRITVRKQRLSIKQKLITRWQKTFIYRAYLKGCDTCKRSWTLKLLRSPFAPLIITVFGLFLACTCLIVGVKAEQWWVKEKVVTVPGIGVRTVKAAAPAADQIAKMTDVEYLYYKFGKRGDDAFRIYKAESGGDAWAINQNTDKGRTLDLGCMQLNEKWQLKPRGLTRADAFNCKKSIDVSYQIFQEQGHFCAWTTYKKMEPNKCK
jgi:hypothetical protein